MMKKRQMVLACMFLASTVNASPVSPELVVEESECNDSHNFFAKREEGWFHYKECIHREEEENPEEEITQAPPPATPSADPLDELKRVKLELDRAQAKAVLYPTEQNVEDFMRLLNKHLKRSAMFADISQITSWTNPELDFRQERPTTPVGLKAWADEYNVAKEETLKSLSKKYGLFFFFVESCVYCHEIAPYIKRFAETYGFTVKAMSLDGSNMAEFPNASYEPTVARTLGVKTTPAVFLVNPTEQQVEPIAYGPISLKELEDRIYRLFAMEKGQPVFKTN